MSEPDSTLWEPIQAFVDEQVMMPNGMPGARLVPIQAWKWRDTEGLNKKPEGEQRHG
jgi:hypothetical protein